MRNLFPLLLLVLLAGFASAQTETLPPSPDQVPLPGENTPTKKADTELGPTVQLPTLTDPNVTLLGGLITKLDPVRDQFTLRAFAGKRMVIAYDVRTRFFLDGNPGSERDLKAGQRVHIDTTLDSKDRVFVKTVWIQSPSVAGVGRGQVVNYSPSDQVLLVRDELSSQPMRFKLGPNAVVKVGDKTGSANDLASGSLVTMTFGPQQGSLGTLNEVSILAKPGQQFVFFGRITYIDLARRRFAVTNNSDHKNYDLDAHTLPDNILPALHEGSEVTVNATFTGKQYVADRVSSAPGEGAETPQ
ncbi:MAG: hypothetical protein H0X25_06955 [Acidobacteriales bacterium]|nr:hypothetical protein [Terriglobales bacterium]